MSNLFTFHKLNQIGINNALAIKQAFEELEQKLTIICPAGRERSIVMTKLEEACFFAKKAMANDGENQEKP